MAELPWSIIDSFNDPSDSLDMFNDLLLTVINRHARIKQKRVKKQTQPEWITQELLNAIHTRDYLHKKKDFEKYKLWRNKVKEMIKAVKRDYYTKGIKNNSKSTKKNL